MDARSFDTLTRQLTKGLPRRQSLALMIGGMASLLLGGRSRVAAGCKKVGKKCDKNKDCCDGAQPPASQCHATSPSRANRKTSRHRATSR